MAVHLVLIAPLLTRFAAAQLLAAFGRIWLIEPSWPARLQVVQPSDLHMHTNLLSHNSTVTVNMHHHPTCHGCWCDHSADSITLEQLCSTKLRMLIPAHTCAPVVITQAMALAVRLFVSPVAAASCGSAPSNGAYPASAIIIVTLL